MQLFAKRCIKCGMLNMKKAKKCLNCKMELTKYTTNKVFIESEKEMGLKP